MKIKNIHDFAVETEVAKDNTVYGVDKATRRVFTVNDEPFSKVVEMLSFKNEGRYDFWTEVVKNA